MSKETKEELSPNDLVKLVNISGEGTYFDEEKKEKKHKAVPLSFQYDGVEYNIPVDGQIVVKRLIAEHGRRKVFVTAWGANRNRAKVVELPFKQRKPEEYPIVSEELDKAISEKDKLEKENEALKLKIAALEKNKK